ncbi:hypothetical protein L2E82_23186 [Cichorium intybus]|uniref:Uncharacterized protein n=1 Tax=Cichorium intybus TaxID=13427 RepID=A0ACB9DZR4_CICIN|nr:hypothetical protein L2E82_23186 [Cichorium intybus]
MHESVDSLQAISSKATDSITTEIQTIAEKHHEKLDVIKSHLPVTFYAEQVTRGGKVPPKIIVDIEDDDEDDDKEQKDGEDEEMGNDDDDADKPKDGNNEKKDDDDTFGPETGSGEKKKNDEEEKQADENLGTGCEILTPPPKPNSPKPTFSQENLNTPSISLMQVMMS